MYSCYSVTWSQHDRGLIVAVLDGADRNVTVPTINGGAVMVKAPVTSISDTFLILGVSRITILQIEKAKQICRSLCLCISWLFYHFKNEIRSFKLEKFCRKLGRKS
jgi:hypothetical protein